MAEVGVIALALQIADIGVRLSLRLYTFGETVASADKSIIAISEHVSLTSAVLKELGQTLDNDQTSRICSPNAVQTADSIVKQCQSIFQEMEHVLVKKFVNTKSTEKDRRMKAAQTLERLKWPFIKGKMDLLMSNLEKQKSALVLMLNVIVLAKQEHERTEPYTIIAGQRSLIEDLARSNEGYIRKFERLKLSCEDAPTDQESVSADWSSSMPKLKTRTAYGLASTLAVDAPSPRKPSADAKGLDPEPYKASDIPSFSSSDRLGWLMQQYTNLMRALLREVSKLDYEIAEESRSRIKADIVSTQRREMNTLSKPSHHLAGSASQGFKWRKISYRLKHFPLSRKRPNSPTMHDNAEPKVDVEQVRPPLQHVTTQDLNRHWSNSQSEANNLSSVARSSNRLNEIQSADPAAFNPAAPKSAAHASVDCSENDNLPQSYVPQAPPIPGLHSRTVPPAQVSNFPLAMAMPQMSRRTRKFRTVPFVSALSSTRLRISKVDYYAGPVTVNEDPPAPQTFGRPQTFASEGINVANYCQGSTTNSPTKHNWTLNGEESFERIFENDGSKDWAEHIVDKLLVTWTTLPLHASQIDPRHGSLAEAAY